MGLIPVKVRRKGRDRKPHRSLEAFGDDVHEHQTEFGSQPGQQLDFTAAPEYEFWCRVGQAVHELPEKYEFLPFLFDLAESGNLDESRKKHGLSRTTARRVFRDLLFRARLEKSAPARGPAAWLK